MKTKLILGFSAAALLLAQSCTKNQTTTVKTPAADTKLKLNSGTVAYQDNAATAFFQRTSGAEAFDGAFSIPMGDGTVIWVNNDSYYNQLSGGVLPCIFNNHNTTLLQPASHSWNQSLTSTLTYLGGATLFTPLNSSHWYWPCAGTQFNNLAYVYLNEIGTASGGLGFATFGQILGALNPSTHAVTYTNLPSLNGIDFGIGMIQGLDGNVYTYGYKAVGAPSVAANIYVARFPKTNPGSWTFWNGSSWVSAATSAAVIGQAPSNGTYIGWINNKVVMITTQFNLQCDQGTAIYGCKSSSLTGPFSAQQVIYNIPDRLQGHTPFFYTPVIHAEFTASNEFLFTYCINTYAPCVAACVNSQFLPDSYRPKAVRVPYVVLGL